LLAISIGEATRRLEDRLAPLREQHHTREAVRSRGLIEPRFERPQ
jgi:hypothetical protein